MLFGEDFGWCYQCYLVIGFYGLQGGEGGDYGFVGVDVVLYQVQYWFVLGQVVGDFCVDLVLCVGWLEVEVGKEVFW